jgi:SfnB family sulfur acquisition oxidoreductase
MKSRPDPGQLATERHGRDSRLSARRIETGAEAIEAARDLAVSISPGAAARDRSGSVPRQELLALADSGLLGITIPLQFGGAGLSPIVLAEVIRLIAAADPAIAQVPQGHFLLIDTLAEYGTDEQRQHLYGDVLAGARIAAALAERGGQHSQDLKTRVRRTPQGTVIDGRKYYSTGALTAEWIAVSALDDDDKLVVAFVRAGSPGLELDEDWDVMGQRATVSGSTILDSVAIEAELVLPYYAAFQGPQQLGARAQLVHAAIQVGIADAALRDAGEFVRQNARPFFEASRAGWAERASDDPHVIGLYGRMSTKVAAAEALLAQAAHTVDAVGLRPTDATQAARGSLAVAQAKAFASEVAVEVSSDLFSLSGASAVAEKYDLSRHWRNARTHASHDPVHWKYHHIGNFGLNDVLPPNHGQL